MANVRNSAKAVIIHDGRLLCAKYGSDRGVHYALPGGGQERGETLVQALVRECREEVSADVTVHELLFVREYLAAHYEWAEDPEFHQVEFMFSCSLNGSQAPFSPGDEPDGGQVGVEWLPLDRLDGYALYPQALIPLLMEIGRGCAPAHGVYLGDVD